MAAPPCAACRARGSAGSSSGARHRLIGRHGEQAQRAAHDCARTPGRPPAPPVVPGRRSAHRAPPRPPVAARSPGPRRRTPPCSDRWSNRRRSAFSGGAGLARRRGSRESRQACRCPRRSTTFSSMPTSSRQACSSSARLPAGGPSTAQERHRAGDAERADRGVGVRELQRRHREPVAVRHGDDADRPPLRVVAAGGPPTRPESRWS